MKDLAVNAAINFQVPMLQACEPSDGEFDHLFDSLIMQLWSTYCKMGRTRLH